MVQRAAPRCDPLLARDDTRACGQTSSRLFRVLSEDSSDRRARMSFPRRARPATAEEVRQTRAIFSLADAGDKVRVVKGLALPIPARWRTHKGAPYIEEGPDRKARIA